MPASLIARKAALDLVRAKFDGKPLDWGQYDCAKLALACARALGHKIRISPFGSYKTPQGATAALARRGFSDLPELIDSLGFERIPPASALPADIIGFLPQPDPDAPLPGDHFTSLTLNAGNGRVFGFHAGTGICCTVQPDYTGALRPPIAWRL